VRTAAKRLYLATVRRRFRVRCAEAARRWQDVTDDAMDTHDPQAMEMAAAIGVLIGALLHRAEELDDDCAPGVA